MATQPKNPPAQPTELEPWVLGKVRPGFTSPGFERAANRVDLEVIGVAGQTEIVRVG